MASQAPQTLFLQVKDESLDVLFRSKVITKHVPNIIAESWNDVLQVLDALATGEHDYKVLCIDGASGLQEFCDADVIKNSCKNDIENFVGFGRGDKLSIYEWQDFLNKVRRLVKEKKMTVILLAHLDTVTMKNPTGLDYIKWRPAISKEKFTATNKYADAILLMDHQMNIQDSAAPGQLKKAGKASGGFKRVMRCDGSAAFEAKNRLNLPAEIPLGSNHEEAWAAFSAAIKEARA